MLPWQDLAGSETNLPGLTWGGPEQLRQSHHFHEYALTRPGGTASKCQKLLPKNIKKQTVQNSKSNKIAKSTLRGQAETKATLTG